MSKKKKELIGKCLLSPWQQTEFKCFLTVLEQSERDAGDLKYLATWNKKIHILLKKMNLIKYYTEEVKKEINVSY